MFQGAEVYDDVKEESDSESSSDGLSSSAAGDNSSLSSLADMPTPPTPAAEDGDMPTETTPMERTGAAPNDAGTTPTDKTGTAAPSNATGTPVCKMGTTPNDATGTQIATSDSVKQSGIITNKEQPQTEKSTGSDSLAQSSSSVATAQIGNVVTKKVTETDSSTLQSS